MYARKQPKESTAKRRNLAAELTGEMMTNIA
jgi:hypothetical protein